MCSVEEGYEPEQLVGLVWKWIETYGIPAAVACRRALLQRPESDLTIEEQLRGEVPETLFAKFLRRMGVDARPLNSDNESRKLANLAKQIRSARNELRLAGVTTPEGANALLGGEYQERLNAQFASDWTEENNYHVAIIDGTRLSDVFGSGHMGSSAHLSIICTGDYAGTPRPHVESAVS